MNDKIRLEQAFLEIQDIPVHREAPHVAANTQIYPLTKKFGQIPEDNLFS